MKLVLVVTAACKSNEDQNLLHTKSIIPYRTYIEALIVPLTVNFIRFASGLQQDQLSEPSNRVILSYGNCLNNTPTQYSPMRSRQQCHKVL